MVAKSTNNMQYVMVEYFLKYDIFAKELIEYFVIVTNFSSISRECYLF